MPLWRPYRKMIESSVADINNVWELRSAGAITAALYLQEFVQPGIPWAHLDVMAWNPKSRPGRPEGGEAIALRALYAPHLAPVRLGGVTRTGDLSPRGDAARYASNELDGARTSG